MTKHKLLIQDELAKLRRELDALDTADPTEKNLKNKISQLNQRRAELEQMLLDDLFAANSSHTPNVWNGVRHGMLIAVKELEKNLKKSIRKEEQQRIAALRKQKFSAWGVRLSQNPVIAWTLAVVLIYLLLLAVGCLGAGFKSAFGGAEGARQLFAFATNPFMGLITGLLATALIQSSSTTTSIIVALCAAGMPVATAIPMVMGANVGTSVTNTLVSLGSLGNGKREFRRAFAAATIHDFFNILAIMIFFPLEIMFHLLERLSGMLTGIFFGAGSMNLEHANVLKPLLKPVEKALQQLFGFLPGPEWVAKTGFLLFGLVLIFGTILLLGKLLRKLLTGRAEKIFHCAVGRSPISAIGSGLAITVLVQSSSTTTSLIVPLAGAGVMTLQQVYPFTLGANIGTCVTALLAAMAITGSGAAAALQIALIHLLFNTLGVMLIYGVAFLRNIPLFCATRLAHAAGKHRAWALVYVIGVFFLLPLLCIGVYRCF